MSKALINEDFLRSCLLVIPAYNEDGEILGVLDQIRAAAPGIPICVVNDCSTDNTLELLASATKRMENLVVLSHPINQGYGATIQTGYKYALKHDYRYIIQLDADGQHDPKEIPLFLERMVKDFPDVILGSRFFEVDRTNTYQVRGLKRAVIWAFQCLLQLRYRVKITDVTTGYQMLSRRALELYCEDLFPSDYSDANLIGLGLSYKLRYVEIPVRMKERAVGESMHDGLFKKAYYVYKVSFLTLLSFLPAKGHR